MPRTSGPSTIDEIDRRILTILAKDPRIPYSDISSELAEEGFEMSSEAIRRRVSSLLKATTSFFLLRPNTYDWEIVLITVKTTDGTDAKQEAFESISDMSFWFVGSGFGTIDIYAIATVNSSEEVDRIINEVKGIETVDEADFFVETDRATAVERYLQVD